MIKKSLRKTCKVDKQTGKVWCGVYMKERQVVADTMAFAFSDDCGLAWGGCALSFFGAESGRRSQFSARLCPAPAAEGLHACVGATQKQPWMSLSLL